ncbi:hypothetical protein B0T14DRAFT_498525 [Immersiella caudata]|uniref:DUF7726 domain-containing protein n=1 Tax=Immersiella caudata TaxID=314043 RepID=A0AA40BXS9_9PEZI|nr:hypothetical protein B0T14DRAFT_498525 [Immersiella caudata]
MPRIRWPLGSTAHTNAVLAAQKSKNPDKEIQPGSENTPPQKPADTPAEKASTEPKSNGASDKKRKPTEDTGALGTPPPAKKPRIKHIKPSGIQNAAKAVIKEALGNGSLAPPAASNSQAESPPLTSVAKAAVNKARAVKECPSDVLDVSSVPSLEDEGDDGVVRIYDTCDTIRSKIRTLLATQRITQIAFLRAIVKATYGEDSNKVIQSVSYAAFMKQNGSSAGNASAVYYAAYVFFEKLRIKRGEAKSTERQQIERAHPDGLVTRFTPSRMNYLANGTPKKEE